MATKKSMKSNDKKITKAGFIRSLPDRTPAKEVIAKAKEVGLDLNEKIIWTTQSEMRSKANGGAKKAAKKTAAPKGKKGPQRKGSAEAAIKPTASANAPSIEQKMKALIIQLGTTRADEVYRTVRKQLESLAAS